MKGDLKSSVKSVALAMCAWVAATALADAQSMQLSSNAVQGSLSSSSGYSVGSGDMQRAHDDARQDGLRISGITGSLRDGGDVSGTYAVTRFGVRDGRIVAFGRLLPFSSSDLDAAETGASITIGGVLLSSPLEPAGGYGADPMLGYGTRIRLSSIPSSSSMTAMSTAGDAPVSAYSGGELVVDDEPFDASRLGSWTGIAEGYGESGAEARSSVNRMPRTTSFNLARPGESDRNRSYSYDADNDVWYFNGRPIEERLDVGSSDLEADSYMTLDVERDAMSDLGASTGVIISSPAFALTSSSVPLVRLGGSGSLYARREAERAAIITTSRSVIMPVTVVSATCDAVTLSFGSTTADDLSIDEQTVTLTPLDVRRDRVSNPLCDVAAAHGDDDQRNAALLKQLNRLVSIAQ